MSPPSGFGPWAGLRALVGAGVSPTTQGPCLPIDIAERKVAGVTTVDRRGAGREVEVEPGLADEAR
jgi:hypothetical protein